MGEIKRVGAGSDVKGRLGDIYKCWAILRYGGTGWRGRKVIITENCQIVQD